MRKRPYRLNMKNNEKGIEFHYAWLLILIAMVGWKELGYYQCMGTTDRGNMVMWYANLWNIPNKRRQQENNVTFFCIL